MVFHLFFCLVQHLQPSKLYINTVLVIFSCKCIANLLRPGFSRDHLIPAVAYLVTAGDGFREIASVWLNLNYG